MIVATAGHIDHGKTLLVRRLTGIDTDRLPEEKRRGISIDLGFAHLRLPGLPPIGFVDVPGHERFVRNMLAGVCGIDHVLLVVAADDGVMPQTREHLAILDLLGVDRGAIVITKVDRVGPGRVAEVESEVRALVAGTTLAQASAFAVSAQVGDGIAPLREHLAQAAHRQVAVAAEGRRFRMALDRSFTIAGSGTVVTGTIFAGSVQVGDTLLLSPSGLQARVRGLQVQGHAAERAIAGERCAVNLTGPGLERDSTGRGDWLIDPTLHEPTRRLDVRLRVLASEAQPLRHWTPVHLHLATADVTARVVVRRDAPVAPGEQAIVQLLADSPLPALAGDRFILRDVSAQRTLGGGRVIDPFASTPRRRDTMRAAVLEALDREPPEQVLAGLLGACPQGVDLDRFARRANLQPSVVEALCASTKAVVLGRDHPRAFEATRVAAVREALLASVRAFHARQPQANGIEVAQLARIAAPGLPDEVVQALLREAVGQQKLELAGGRVRLPGFDAAANAADQALWSKVEPLLARVPQSPPQVREIAQGLRVDEKSLQAMLQRRVRRGELVRVDEQRVFLREAIIALAGVAERVAATAPGGRFNAAAFRDATGIGRGLAIQVLEHLDGAGVTMRLGDERRLRRPVREVYGQEPPALPPAPPPAAPPGARPQASARPGQRPGRIPPRHR
jgi:selenocysteine-specific elongation factor